MKQKLCPHCECPLRCINICANCKRETEPISLTAILLIAGGIFLVGYLLGIIY